MNPANILVEHFGGRKQTAEAMSVSLETIRLWLRDGIPLEKSIDVEGRSGGAVTAEQILAHAKGVSTPASPSDEIAGFQPFEDRTNRHWSPETRPSVTRSAAPATGAVTSRSKGLAVLARQESESKDAK